MESFSKRQRRSTVQIQRRSSRYPAADDDSEPSRVRTSQHHSEIIEPLLAKEMRGRQVLGDKHRLLHNRQAGSPVVTAVVSVVATVDDKGQVIAEEVIPSPSLSPVLPAAVPSLPTVPQVPPFPSDLTVPAVPIPSPVVLPTVPAYPFNSVTTSAALSTPALPAPSSPSVSREPQASLTTTSPSLSLPSPLPTGPTLIPGNFTVPQNISSSVSNRLTPLNANSTAPVSITSILESSALTSDFFPTPSATEPPASSRFPGPTPIPPAGGTPSQTGGTTGESGGGGTDGSSGPDRQLTAKVAGGVVGGLAGVATILVIVLLLLRWYKNKRGSMQRLGDNDELTDNNRAMTEHNRSFLPGTAGALLNRFSASSRGTSATAQASPQERGFQRISGRKLPSAFSEGMSSTDFNRDSKKTFSGSSFYPHDPNTLSGSSFYRDSQGFWGGIGDTKSPTSAGPGTSRGQDADKEMMMPSPARTPTIVHSPSFESPSRPAVPPIPPGSGGLFTPPRTPAHSDHVPRGTLGRSHPSHDGSRGSRFTEDV